MTAAQFVLWGWKAGYGPAPIKLTGGNQRHCNGEKRRREPEGWLLGIYGEGEPPTGLRDQVTAALAATWHDTPEQKDRLGDLERRVLDGVRTDDELAEYRELAAAHEAWLVLQPQFWAWVDEQEARTGIPHAPRDVTRPPGC